ncbi:histidinol-phosphate transaminase [Variovorax sp. J22R115]|uniref:histidinol-phosphate transaminase n=1 Tax=Variovorax sp. J22R115 TaxID=3053509 RepID=UPI002576FB7A|nr:histidinol-phosphate transaminase [Variovorax sp. J22R115]MDM0051052.1 histidinol-phosphate transaminase [Variovorax sp. J22R115]
MILLASNENPLGMPESARRAAAAALEGAGNYPDSNGTALKNALAARLDVPLDWLTLGCGSSEILELAAQVSLKPGEGVVYSQYGFVVYAQAAAHAHAKSTVVPARDFGHDLQAMRAAIGEDTRLVFVANPNNPTGTFLEAGPLLDFLQAVPTHVTVLLDEAYTEYLAPAQRYGSIEWVRRFPNLIVARTFSKAYGLAGMRIGYGVSQSALASRMNAQRPRFNVSSPAQAAALAALADEAFLARSYQLNMDGRAQLAAGLAELGLQTLPSSGNFLMVQVGDGQAICSRLMAAGIAVSTLDGYGVPQWLRITIGLPEQNRAVLAALRDAIGAR